MTRRHGGASDPEDKARKILKVFLRKIRQAARYLQKDWPGEWGRSEGFNIALTNTSAPIDFKHLQSVLGKDADETLDWINSQTCVTRLIGDYREVRRLPDDDSCLKIGWKYSSRPRFELMFIST